MTGNKSGHDSGPHHQTRAFCEIKKGQLRSYATVLFWAQYKQWVHVYTLNMLYVPSTIVQCLWVFDWKLQISWLYPHLSKWGSQCYMRKEEDRSSYTNDHRFCVLKDRFSLNLLLSFWPMWVCSTAIISSKLERLKLHLNFYLLINIEVVNSFHWNDSRSGLTKNLVYLLLIWLILLHVKVLPFTKHTVTKFGWYKFMSPWRQLVIQVRAANNS